MFLALCFYVVWPLPFTASTLGPPSQWSRYAERRRQRAVPARRLAGGASWLGGGGGRCHGGGGVQGEHDAVHLIFPSPLILSSLAERRPVLQFFYFFFPIFLRCRPCQRSAPPCGYRVDFGELTLGCWACRFENPSCSDSSPFRRTFVRLRAEEAGKKHTSSRDQRDLALEWGGSREEREMGHVKI